MYDLSKFCYDLRNVDWNANAYSHVSKNINNVCVGNAWSRFKTLFLKIADRHAPFIQKWARGLDNCPWINGQIKHEIRHWDFLLSKAEKSKLDEHWLAYLVARNRVSNAVRKAKQIYNLRNWLKTIRTILKLSGEQWRRCFQGKRNHPPLRIFK